MNQTTTSNASLPLRVGDQVRTLPCSGDQLKGRVTAVFKPATSNQQPATLYYRVRFPAPSPYFFGDEGAVYRAHEIELNTQPEVITKTKLPQRPKPFTT